MLCDMQELLISMSFYAQPIVLYINTTSTFEGTDSGQTKSVSTWKITADGSQRREKKWN